MGFETDVQRIQAGTHVVVDLDAYAANIRLLKTKAGDDKEFMAVVKADAYGHGAVECARAAIEAGASMLGVARIQEGLYLRRRGVSARIVLIGPPTIPEMSDAIANDITLCIGSWQALRGLEAIVDGSIIARVHLKVDTGMNRNGFPCDQVVEAAKTLAQIDGVEVEGVFTHFSSADELDPTPTSRQIDRFLGVVDDLDEHNLRPRYVHMSNSAAILTGRVEGMNLVRSGIATFGLSPSDDVRIDDSFQPVMSMHSVVARRGVLREGEGVCYGLTYCAETDEPIAVVPVGYADGLPRRLRNLGWFVVHGQASPIRGSVCMDQTVVGVDELTLESDNVLVYGSGTDGEMTLDDIARLIGTVNYEVATRVTARVPRLYVRGGQPVAWEHLLTGERGRCEE